MNNGLKALLIAASTIITCIIVGLGFHMARQAKQIGNYVVEDLHQYSRTIEERDYTKYDGVTVYGSDVTNLIKKENGGSAQGVRITVQAGKQTVSYATKENSENARNPESPVYIAPTVRYLGIVLRNENDVITELKFIKQE